MAPRPAGLDVRDVTVRFRGVVANDAVSLRVEPGAIGALIGPNGAGKTTLFNAISGLVRPERATIELDGRDVTGLDSVRRAELGLARTFQSLLLVPSLSVFDNVVIGAARLGRFGRLRNVVRRDALTAVELRSVVARALDFVGMADRGDEAVDGLPYGDRRRVELARALASAPRLLLLDEPASGLPHVETMELIEVIRRARAELGTTVLVVEHDMSFVRAIAESVTVLDFGRVLASGPTAAVLEDQRVVEAYLGSEAAARPAARPPRSRSRRSAVRRTPDPLDGKAGVGR